MSVAELQKFTAISKYARYIKELKRRETWEETVWRNRDMMNERYPSRLSHINKLYEEYVITKKVLPSMRGLQFGGPPILKANARIYNCTSSHVDRLSFFGQALYLLLCGCGVGYSVQQRHLRYLPRFSKARLSGRKLPKKTFRVPDSIEGWATCAHVQMTSYHERPVPGFEDWMDCDVVFDYEEILKGHPEGTPLSFGIGLAPGPKPLAKAMAANKALLNKALAEGLEKLNSIYASDYHLHDSEAVVSGGVRRSANIGIFDFDDEAMFLSKTGNWRQDNLQRSRANISAALLRGQVDYAAFEKLMWATRQYGEPGFYFTDDLDVVPNPCQPASATVLTPSGIRTFGDIKEGDLIWSETGWTKVLKKWSNGVKPVFKYVTETGVFLGTENHRVVNGGVKQQVKDAERIDTLVGPDYNINKVFPYQYSLIEGSEDSLQNIQLLLSSIGICSKIYYDSCICHLEILKEPLKTSRILYIAPEGDMEVFDITVDNEPHTYWTGGLNVSNCVEIGLLPILEINKNDRKYQELIRDYDGPIKNKSDNVVELSGFQACNLSTTNGKQVESETDFFLAVEAAAELGTYQAGFDDFGFVGPITTEIVRREALLGVSICGVMHNPRVMLDPSILEEGASRVRAKNVEVARAIGINEAARLTCIKPDGNSASVLGSFSGCHPGKIHRGFRIAQANKKDAVYKHFKGVNPEACEESVWSKNKVDDCIRFPIEYKGLLEDEMGAIAFLEAVRTLQNHWVRPGTVPERCVRPSVLHNVSNTVKVKDDQWDEVSRFIFQNQKDFGGVSFISHYGDRDYAQAPFTPVLLHGEMVAAYGAGAVEQAKKVLEQITFSNSGELWDALDGAIRGDEDALFVDAFKKLAIDYLDSNLLRASHVIKDVYNLHLWERLCLSFKPVDYTEMVEEVSGVNFAGEVACGAGGCET